MGKRALIRKVRLATRVYGIIHVYEEKKRIGYPQQDFNPCVQQPSAW